MFREHRRWFSPALGRDMELLVFGHGGARVIVFPTSMGRFYEWEDRGMIGALILDFNGKRLEVAGLTDEERAFEDGEYAAEHPEEDMPATVEAVRFKRGQVVTFKYRELSDDGIPKEARYFRAA